MLVTRHFISLCFFVFHFARALLIQAFVSKADFGQLQTTSDVSVCSRFWMNPDDSGRLRTTPNDSKRVRTTSYDSRRLRLRTTPDSSGRFRAILDDSERFRMIQGGPYFRSRFRINWSRIGVDSGFLPTLPITSMNIKLTFKIYLKRS